MKELILILLFGKAVLLTPNPVDLNNAWFDLTPSKTLKALNGGASLNVQLSTDSQELKEIDKNKDIFTQLSKIFPNGSIEAILTDEKNGNIRLSNNDFSISDFTLSKKDSVWVVLSSQKPFPTDREFKSIKIRSKKNIRNARILWKNYSK